MTLIAQKVKNIINIIPLNDIKEHEEESICECCPDILNENGKIILVHHSFDGREGVEWTNEILSQPPYDD